MRFGQLDERLAEFFQALLKGAGAVHDRLDLGEVLVTVALEGGQEQVLLAGEVGVERADGEAGLLGDVVHGGAGVALAGEHPRGRLEQVLTGLGSALGSGAPAAAVFDPLRSHSDDYYRSDRYPSMSRRPALLDVVIVGGGPAGLSAALLLGRARRDVPLCDSDQPRNAGVHAMPGFLARDVEVEAVTGQTDQFTVRLADGTSEQARRLLLATGVADELPPINGLGELWGRGAFNCPYCDGWEVRDQPVAVLAADPRNLQLAVHLTRWSPDVLLCSNGADLDDDTRRLLTARKVRLRGADRPAGRRRREAGAHRVHRRRARSAQRGVPARADPSAQRPAQPARLYPGGGRFGDGRRPGADQRARGACHWGHGAAAKHAGSRRPSRDRRRRGRDRRRRHRSDTVAATARHLTVRFGGRLVVRQCPDQAAQHQDQAGDLGGDVVAVERQGNQARRGANVAVGKQQDAHGDQRPADPATPAPPFVTRRGSHDSPPARLASPVELAAELSFGQPSVARSE